MAAYNTTSSNLGLVVDLLHNNNKKSYPKNFQPFTFYLAKPSICCLKVTEYRNQPMLHIIKGKGFVALHMHEFEDFICYAKQIKDKMIECRNACEIHNTANDAAIEDEENYCVLPTKRKKKVKMSKHSQKKLKATVPEEEEEDDDTVPLADSN
jgi:hypothetical protein